MTTALDTTPARAQRKITRRLIPFLFLLYITAYLDRVNVSFAGLEMTRELKFSNEVFGFGAGIFFFGYCLLEIPGATAEEPRIGQHRQARRAVPRIARRDRRRIKILAQHAPARTRFLDFGNHRRPAGAEFRAQRRNKIARPGFCLRLRAHHGQRLQCFRSSDLLGLDGKYALQEVRHGALQALA